MTVLAYPVWGMPMILHNELIVGFAKVFNHLVAVIVGIAGDC